MTRLKEQIYTKKQSHITRDITFDRLVTPMESSAASRIAARRVRRCPRSYLQLRRFVSGGRKRREAAGKAEAPAGGGKSHGAGVTFRKKHLPSARQAGSRSVPESGGKSGGGLSRRSQADHQSTILKRAPPPGSKVFPGSRFTIPSDTAACFDSLVQLENWIVPTFSTAGGSESYVCGGSFGMTETDFVPSCGARS